MRTRVAFGLFFIGLSVLLNGCGAFDFEEREPWRDAAEARCLAAGEFAASAYAEPLRAIGGPRTCGLEHPFMVVALADGSVGIQPSARLGCPVASALNRWLRDVVQPVAQANFGQPVVALKNAASYGCRTRNNKKGAKLSEHAFGNALDVRAFYLADGREITIARGWRGAADERAFLRQVHGGACGAFKTVLGPGSDGYHEDHLHLDLARHDARGERAYCRPQPVSTPNAPVMQPDPYGSYPAQQPGYGDTPFPQGPYGNVPMSYAAEPRWPIARAPSAPPRSIEDVLDE